MSNRHFSSLLIHIFFSLIFEDLSNVSLPILNFLYFFSCISSLFTVSRIHFLVQIRVFFIKLNTFLMISVVLNNVRTVTKIFIFFPSLFVRLKSDDNSRLSVRVFKFRCNFHCIDLICTRIIYRDRIWKSRVRFSFAKKLKRLIFLCSKIFKKMFIANSNCAICSICFFPYCFITWILFFDFITFNSFVQILK